MISPASLQEWRQFRILARDSVRKLLNSAMLARDADPVQFALWTTTLVATPPALYAFGQLFKYSTLRSAPPDLIERIVSADRMFFIVYSLIAAALLAAMTWDALYPDRDEQEVIGALPVRPRTATAARLCAALGVATGFALAINLPSAVFFAFVSVSHPVAGFLPVVFVAHLVSTTSGCVTVFAVLLAVRGIVSLALGSAVTDRFATGLQLVTVVAIVEVFFYLPSILPVLVRLMMTGDTVAMWTPSTWFGALYGGLAGPRHAVFLGEASLGLVVLASTLTAIVPLYLLPSRLMARRALESPPDSGRRVWYAAAVRQALAILSGSAPGLSVAVFSLVSLVRSRRHMLVAVTYVGVGVALALVQVIASGLRGGIRIETPGRALLAAPLVMMFFTVIGLRAAFRIPRDLDANWPFRLYGPTAVEAAAGTHAALFLAGVAPILVLVLVGTQTAQWTVVATLQTTVFNLLAGLLLLECALYGWSLVPFACARPDGHEAMQTRWLAASGPFILFVFGGATLQLAALRSARVAAWLAVITLVLTFTVGSARRSRARREAIPFDGPAGHLELLNLSEASS
jgi:hypothetical protein